MIFKHDLIELPKLNRIDGDQRQYELPTGQRYPSVTTVLSNTADKSFLIKWKKRVGESEANKITQRSGRRGTAVHNLCEKLVFNQELNLKNEMPINTEMFNQVRRVLEAHVDSIRISEGYLYSHKLKVAGAVDLVASYNGSPAIIDFKTAMKQKRREWIEDYFIQASMYSFMLYEMTGILHPKLVIIIAVESEDRAQVFECNVSKWINKARDRCRLYHEKSLPEIPF